MWTRQRKRRRYGALIVPAISAVFLSYFGYHAFHGEYGIEAARVLSVRIAERRAELEVVRAERARLEQRLALLRDGSLERDMLDEQARRALNLAREDEIVIYRSAAD